jgi:hypothetical protein
MAHYCRPRAAQRSDQRYRRLQLAEWQLYFGGLRGERGHTIIASRYNSANIAVIMMSNYVGYFWGVQITQYHNSNKLRVSI